jgi:Protein of unknown function (DUF1588)/Protein of unknown function (DUF1592)/Protein of unknown function (DUF1585)/Protein of unknown function (DUF1595)/Protein of unknown function (DUF1587)
MPRRYGLPVRTQGILLASTMALAALAGGPGFGCAGTGHGSGAAPDDGGGSSSGGSGSDAGNSGDSAPTQPPPPGPQGVGIFSQTCSPGPATVDWSPMRRISRVEYDNMVRDLLGDTTQPAAAFPPESPMAAGVNFNVNTYTSPSTAAVQDYLQAAETLAESVVSDANRLTNLLGGIPSCASARDDTCVKDFIAGWVNRAYRGQLDSTESAGLFDLYSTVKAQFDWPTGLQAVVTAVLESHRFLYVMEFGSGSPSGKVVALSPDEVAARLALFLWRSVPDVQMMTDASQGKLATAAGVLAEARYMLTGANQAKAQAAIDDFTTQWLQLTGIQAKDLQFQYFSNNESALIPEMYEETRLDMSQLVLAENGGQGGTLTELLTSPSSYINGDLLNFYAHGPGNGPITMGNPMTNGYGKTSLPNRAGILTNASVMATQAHSSLPSFVLRGKLVRENVLCDPIPPPPPNVPAAPTVAPADGGTTRDLLLAHQQKGTVCPTCHQYMDGIGAAFGNFDATGAYQATDANGQTDGPAKPASAFPAIDSSGSIQPMSQGELQTTFKNVTDLVTQLAAAKEVQQCFTLQELRYALGRIESPADVCSAQQAYGTFSANNLNVQGLLFAIVQSDAFRYRSVEMPGSACQ